jgi:twinkle protein
LTAARLAEHGIRLKSYAMGEHRAPCPKCSHTRRKAGDPCLGVKIDADGATWTCHHCGWAGATGTGEARPQPQRRAWKPKAPAPVQVAIRPLGAAGEAFLHARGIGREVAERFGVGEARAWIAAKSAEADCLAFPCRAPGGAIVNAKFRAIASKDFAQTKGGARSLFGLDLVDVTEGVIVIVEGELDALACAEAGVVNAVSVPDGAPAQVSDKAPRDDDPRFACLAAAKEDLDQLGRIVIATDADAPGDALAEELARRLGRERCWRAAWPEDCKDANDVLLKHGPDVLRACIADAEPWPIRALFDVSAFAPAVLSLYRDGRSRGVSTGFRALDPFYTVRPGELSVVSGYPSMGKSEFVDAVAVNLARDHGWKFAVCSFENPPDEHISKLAEKYTGSPFWDGPRPRMTEGELQRALTWAGEHFHFIRAEDDAPTICWLLEAAKSAVLRRGIKGLVIDPWNEIEHQRPAGMTETELVSQTLGRVKRFAANYGVHVWFIAHPAKPQRDKDGKIPVPTLYDISGSANWTNKADVGLVIHRDPLARAHQVDVHIRKCRFKSVGKPGFATLDYDLPTGRYSDPIGTKSRGAA